jgi:hypothetical protein
MTLETSSSEGQLKSFPLPLLPFKWLAGQSLGVARMLASFRGADILATVGEAAKILADSKPKFKVNNEPFSIHLHDIHLTNFSF